MYNMCHSIYPKASQKSSKHQSEKWFNKLRKRVPEMYVFWSERLQSQQDRWTIKKRNHMPKKCKVGCMQSKPTSLTTPRRPCRASSGLVANIFTNKTLLSGSRFRSFLQFARKIANLWNKQRVWCETLIRDIKKHRYVHWMFIKF